MEKRNNREGGGTNSTWSFRTCDSNYCDIMLNTSGAVQCGKRKKKRSFLQKQKRFAKNGRFGRGTQLSPDMYEYFIHIMKAMNSQKDDEEEMGVLSSNVFHELKEKESEYCCNQIVSRVVENLLPYSTDDEFLEFITKFSENLRPIFCDAFGSHVLQQTIVTAYNKYQKCLSNKSDNKLHVKFFDYILKISKFLFNNLEDFIWDTYSNAIARTVFNILSGNPVKGELKPPLEVKEEGSNVKIPVEFNTLLRDFAKRILSWPQFNDLCSQPINSNFIRSLLQASKKFDEGPELVDKVITFYKSKPLDLTDEENDPFVRLLEDVLSVCDEERFKRTYKFIFKRNLVNLSLSKCGNFSVQKLISNCNNKKMFEKIFAELSPQMKDVLRVKHSGVLLALVKRCKSLEVLQGECMTMLINAFGAKDAKDVVPFVASLTPSDKFEAEASKVSLHGSLILEELLNFKKPINVVNGLLELPDSSLVKLLSDVKGSHITDAFVNSSSIGEKSRDKLFKKLRSQYLSLATSKHGSRSLDAIWSAINVQQKALLAEELKSSQSELCASVYGNGFARKIHLSNFRRNKEEWIKLQKTSANAEKYFSDIIPKKRQKTG